MMKVWACMVFLLKVGDCMVTKSENTKRKSEVECKEETGIHIESGYKFNVISGCELVFVTCKPDIVEFLTTISAIFPLKEEILRKP